MKKIIALITSICLILVSMTVCGNPLDNVKTLGLGKYFTVDNTNAIVELTFSTGNAKILGSYNGSHHRFSGQQIALDNTGVVKLETGETCHVHFYCETCGYDIIETLPCPSARCYHCNCPETPDNAGNMREYYCIEVKTKKADTDTSNP